MYKTIKILMVGWFLIISIVLKYLNMDIFFLSFLVCAPGFTH